MACPHVSGGVALLISAKPELAGDSDYDGVKKALLGNAFRSALTGTGRTWGGNGGIPDTEFPNHVFGKGRLDIAASAGVV
jgi:subtilisin family serine protease